jgi:ribonuclease HII
MDITAEAIGVDEAGRGCLAGPVCAAAVLWDAGVRPVEILQDRAVFVSPTTGKKVVIRDSKKLSEKQRAASREFIEQHAAAYGVAMVDALAVDAEGILPATMRAMHHATRAALAKAAPGARVRLAMVDGNYFVPLPGLRHECVVGGDGKVLAIAAASILAKTHRDAYITASPNARAYGWQSNKGYGTALHMGCIEQQGLCPEHRRTFCGGQKQTRVAECVLLLDGEQAAAEPA